MKAPEERTLDTFKPLRPETPDGIPGAIGTERGIHGMSWPKPPAPPSETDVCDIDSPAEILHT